MDALVLCFLEPGYDIEWVWPLCFSHPTWVLGYVEHWDLVGNSCGIPPNRAAHLYLRLNIKYNSSTWACTILIVATLSLFDIMRISTLDLALALTLGGCDLKYFTCKNNLHFWSTSHLISWFNKDWHLEICDSSRLAWFLGLNIHLPFFITSHTLMPRLPLTLLRCMVHHGQVLINPSSTTILSHTSLYVFHRLVLENLFLMIKLLP
jgi:hypothetical protein